MAEFPQIARRRLNRVADGGDHPDAGLLTAFLEGTLATAHRYSILDHLAACSECNHLLALIAPERELAPAVEPVRQRRPWFAWAPLRWAGAAAAAAVIASTVWIGRIEQRANPAPAAVAVGKAPAVQLPTTSPQLNERAAATPRRNEARELPQSRELAKAAPAAAQSQPSQANQVIAAESRPAAPGGVRGQDAFQTSMISGVAAPHDMSAAPPAPLPLAATPEPLSQPTVPVPPAKAIGPVWAVSDAGVLQKSEDSGRTWAALPVPSRAPLRAVSVLGTDIWTGGDRGALYHSSDGGQTWTVVVPTSNEQVLSGDVMRIACPDALHVLLATSTGQIWTTRDSGATWTRN